MSNISNDFVGRTQMENFCIDFPENDSYGETKFSLFKENVVSLEHLIDYML